MKRDARGVDHARVVDVLPCVHDTDPSERTTLWHAHLRLEAFSDGVLAIIITVMVLTSQVPEGDSFRSLIDATALPFLTYVLSFTYVGMYCNNHHHLLHAVPSLSGRSWTAPAGISPADVSWRAPELKGAHHDQPHRAERQHGDDRGDRRRAGRRAGEGPVRMGQR
ncbi:TMEM175 family protein [uncultured Corynebacterium sp.]|uniref:TMEM175 family protein n=1 Tax=uncultured Corynebacterium sp. TaxID=159447 RepID=UPI00259988F8|nr:TMEM175 family protein [uncultured Corynebacterium sp.]